MATKLKKRNPVLAFLVFFMALSVLVGSLAGLLAMPFPGNGMTGRIAPDYKLTKDFRKEMGTLIRAGFTLTTDMRFSNEISSRSDATAEGHRAAAQAKLDQEGNNIAYLLLDVEGNYVAGNTEAQTEAEFAADMRQEMERSRNGFNISAISSSNQGYDYLAEIHGNQASVQMNTRVRLPEEETGTISTLSVFQDAFNYDELRQIESVPAGSATICLAVRAEGAFANNYGGIYTSYYEWFTAMTGLLTLCIAALVSGFVLLVLLVKRQSLAIAFAKIAAVSGWFWVEVKAICFVAVAGMCMIALDLWWGEGMLFSVPAFWSFWILYNDLRHNKAGVFKHNIFHSTVRFLQSLESKYPFCTRLKRRLPILICMEIALLLLAVLLFALFGIAGLLMDFLVAGMGLFLLIHYSCSFNKDVDQLAQIAGYASEIRAGTAKVPLVLPQNSDFAPLAADLNDIHSGMVRMVNDRVRSEQMKVELITNVSHDLKTPLTSIINYVDLLSKENLAPEFANDYVKIIAGKSERLKNLVQDLFEISKANSGSIDLNLEQLSVISLVEQTVAELDNRSLQAGVEIKLQLCETPVTVRADGKKLHRVFENLLGNAVKYALAGTRVYVAVTSNGQYAVVTFKNVASYEMNFTAEEIVERFQRGDTSRTSEGSGLGLAIAKSFLELNGGNLQIELDGDLFKATVLLPLYVPYAQREHAAGPVDAEASPDSIPAEQETLIQWSQQENSGVQEEGSASVEVPELVPMTPQEEPCSASEQLLENDAEQPREHDPEQRKAESKILKPDFILYAPGTEAPEPNQTNRSETE